MHVNLSKENNNTADVCGEVKYLNNVKKKLFLGCQDDINLISFVTACHS